MNRGLLLFLFVLLRVCVFAENPAPAASRVVANGDDASGDDGSTVFYYNTLHEAVDAASGVSPDAPDEITLLADVVLNFPVIIDDGKHIALVSGDADRVIRRGSDFLDYPLFWITGDSASLSLGRPAMEHELVIDGGYLDAAPVEARAPLVALNGPDSKLIMFDKVTLQNNCNVNSDSGASLYQSGSGVFIRTAGDLQDRPAEFIMKGGSICGNITDVRNPYPLGAGVYLAAFGTFTMEGGTIFNNTAARAGGGVYIYTTGSFKKTGGIIYGADAPSGLRNTAVTGTGTPKSFGHAVFIELYEQPVYQYRDDTVNENEVLTYTGSPRGKGVFGQGEKWGSPRIISRRNLFIGGIAFAVLCAPVFLFARRRIKKKRQETPPAPAALDLNLSPREREVFNLLLSGLSARQIAAALQLSVSSVNFHSQNIYRKLGIQSKTELLVKFREQGTVSSEQ